MSETEFWREPTGDERYHVPFTDPVGSRPLWISPSRNRWADMLYAKGRGRHVGAGYMDALMR